MSGEWTISWAWWITAIEVPAFGALFWLVHHGRRETERNLLKVYGELQGNLNTALENLAESKLEVARLYATIADLKEVERRLTDHLLRLDARLTYAITGEGRGPRRERCGMGTHSDAPRDRSHGA